MQADHEQLQQVFRNLIENALEHSGDDPPTIHVGVERVGDAYQFTVQDDGVGIDPDHQDQIFDLFEQLDYDKRNTGSVGMGLALCERIIDRHDGDIWVDSEPGNGTTISFTLPIVAETQHEAN